MGCCGVLLLGVRWVFFEDGEGFLLELVYKPTYISQLIGVALVLY
jgi:hypothetical protein